MLFKNGQYTALYPDWNNERHELFVEICNLLIKDNYSYRFTDNNSGIIWENIPLDLARKYLKKLKKLYIMTYIKMITHNSVEFDMRLNTIPIQV